MKHLLPVIALLACASANAATTPEVFNWTPVTQDVNNVALPAPATYDIYQGPLGGPYTLLDSNITTPGVTEQIDFTKGACFVMTAIEPAPWIPSPYSAPFCFPMQAAAPTNVTAKAGS